ncbi:MAG: putative photosynthetic complex assembly protein PuhE [Rhodobacter sp.]|nr:putative photosynthetic complex assembly protein PuhE [Rhodobacter sp.]MCY4167076.1 putative photosynthetic complex assembly protein PuhE [Rhodobacter sp.]MCY4242032.1 putative photosynthetic complex assembly protein PuhE [Rhodobacter sp.]
MAPALTALSAACLVWWLSTGVILVAVRLAERGGQRAGVLMAIAALPLPLLGVWGLWASLTQLTVQGAYTGFLSALALWAWCELAFLSGTVTGPVRSACPPGLGGWRRFRRAWGTVAHHEVLLAVLVVLVVELCRNAPNAVGMWTLLILYFARVSAKLNLFLGVAHANTEFLPRQLSHLSSHFGTARLNWLFPVSITLMTFAFACFIERLIDAGIPGAEAGFALLAALTALALLEHWFLILPWPDAKLWRWMLPKPDAERRENCYGVDP